MKKNNDRRNLHTHVTTIKRLLHNKYIFIHFKTAPSSLDSSFQISQKPVHPAVQQFIDRRRAWILVYADNINATGQQQKVCGRFVSA